MPSVRMLYRADILLTRYGTVDTTHVYGDLNPWPEACYLYALINYNGIWRSKF